MIKNIYEPDNEDVLFWLAHNEKWPDSDWDLYVVNGKNDLMNILFFPPLCRQNLFYKKELFSVISISLKMLFRN